MNIYRHFLLIFMVLMLPACGSGASKEKLARQVLNQLKNNNADGYLKHALNSEDLNEIMDALEKSESFQDYSQERKQKFANTRTRINNIISRHQKKLEKNFHDVFKQGVKKGIDWSRVKYLSLRVGVENPVYDLKEYPAQHLYIIFKHRKKRYMLRLNNAMLTRRGWIVVDNIYWDQYQPLRKN